MQRYLYERKDQPFLMTMAQLLLPMVCTYALVKTSSKEAVTS